MLKEIFEGKTLNEAIDQACDVINIDPEYLYYNILVEGNETTPFKIEAYTMTEVIDFCKEYLLNIIKDYDLQGEISTKIEDGIIKMIIDTNHNSILIGKNGKTLQSLNEMVRSASTCYFKKRFKILLDINDYKNEKYEKIIRIARKVAHEVQRTHIEATLDPMTSDERRMIHNNLSHMAHIKTESFGYGHKRAITISYSEEEFPKAEKEEESEQN